MFLVECGWNFRKFYEGVVVGWAVWLLGFLGRVGKYDGFFFGLAGEYGFFSDEAVGVAGRSFVC